MAVYVDNVKIKWAHTEWCHLVADTLGELHDFAHLLGLKRKWFQGNASYPHYDITVVCRMKAISLGALAGSRKQIICCAKKMKVEKSRAIQAYAPGQLMLFS